MALTPCGSRGCRGVAGKVLESQSFLKPRPSFAASPQRANYRSQTKARPWGTDMVNDKTFFEAHFNEVPGGVDRRAFLMCSATFGAAAVMTGCTADKILNAMVNTVNAGLKAPQGVLPGPIKLKTKAGDVYKRAMEDKYEKQRGLGVVSAYALAGSEENARGPLVITAPTGGSAGVIPAIVYALGDGGRKLPKEKLREGLLAAAAVGYLCKHNATLSGAEGGCQAEANDFGHQVVANAAESALQHHLGLTCDPVAGFVQIPCIERCAFGAVKTWTGFMIASNEIAANRRVDFDTTVSAMALTAKEMNSKYKETSEGGLAVSLVLC